MTDNANASASFDFSRRNGASEEDARLIPTGHFEVLSRPAWLHQDVWPFETFGLGVEGSTVAVTDVGRGPVLLFVHTGFWSFIWRDVILRLADRFRCVTLDAPGTGQSERPAGRTVTLDASARAIGAVIHELDLRDLTLVVHDLGGLAGLAAAAQTPERVRGLVGVNTFAWKPSGTAFRGMLALMGSGPISTFDELTRLLPHITATAFGVGRHMDEPSRNTFLAGIGRRGVRAFHEYMRDARNADGLFLQIQLALAGPFRDLPLLTLFGERNDPFGFQLKWKELYPHARQVVVRRGNHFPMCDDADLVARSIRSWHYEQVAPLITPLGRLG